MCDKNKRVNVNVKITQHKYIKGYNIKIWIVKNVLFHTPLKFDTQIAHDDKLEWYEMTCLDFYINQNLVQWNSITNSKF